jgi:hypothetical protein
MNNSGNARWAPANGEDRLDKTLRKKELGRKQSGKGVAGDRGVEDLHAKG